MDSATRRFIALTVLRSRIRLEIQTGLPFSNRGPTSIQSARDWGYTGKRSRQSVLDWLEEEIAALKIVAVED